MVHTAGHHEGKIYTNIFLSSRSSGKYGSGIIMEGVLFMRKSLPPDRLFTMDFLFPGLSGLSVGFRVSPPIP